jgi:hypothetical protein
MTRTNVGRPKPHGCGLLFIHLKNKPSACTRDREGFVIVSCDVCADCSVGGEG